MTLVSYILKDKIHLRDFYTYSIIADINYDSLHNLIITNSQTNQNHIYTLFTYLYMFRGIA